jgi:hypothetical protein
MPDAPGLDTTLDYRNSAAAYNRLVNISLLPIMPSDQANG